MFAIAWQYLTGRAVAASVTDREVEEWPPHPDRVFQAMVAAWGETGATASGAHALRWLELQGPPEVSTPPIATATEKLDRAFVAAGREKVYVPVNDAEGPKGTKKYSDGLLTLLPSQREKKERYFPATRVGDGVCALVWPAAEAPVEVRAALAQLVSEVACVGHSRSLVRMWVTTDPPAASWVPSTHASVRTTGESLRVPHAGRLDVLQVAFSGGGVGWRRPPTAPWQRYEPARAAGLLRGGAFDDRLLVLRRVDGDPIDLRHTLAFADALRGALIKAADGHPVAMPLISGHLPDGAAMAGTHVAYLPLADVGHGHADGHLLGFALALPTALDADAEQAIYDALADLLDDETQTLRLRAGASGTCTLVVEDRPVRPVALRFGTWSRPACLWGTVTPIVFDQLPPRTSRPPTRGTDSDSGRGDAYDAWAVAQILQACARQGLPPPVEVAVTHSSVFEGVPLARAFPPVLRKADGARRWHVHAVLRFAEPVVGPLLLGAGRYRGMGLCRPMEGL